MLAQKFLLFGLAVYLVIPASVKVSDMIEATYASSIESTLENAKQTTEEIQAETAEGTGEEVEGAQENGTAIPGQSVGDGQSKNAGNKDTALENKEENLAGKQDGKENGKNAVQEKKDGGFLSGLFSKVQEGVSTVQEGVSMTTANVENTLNRFIEALAILLVTSCLIPILVLLFFVWLVKLVLGTNPDIPKRGFK